MKDIAKKYPKAWELFLTHVMGEGEWNYQMMRHDEVKFSLNPHYCMMEELKYSFGCLVLEFFPKHGIEIERYYESWNKIVFYSIRINGERPEKDKDYDTPQEAIEKAFEILEERLCC